MKIMITVDNYSFLPIINVHLDILALMNMTRALKITNMFLRSLYEFQKISIDTLTSLF